MSLCVVVSGANGFVGRRLLVLAHGEDATVITLGRTAPPGRVGNHSQWSLGQPVPTAARIGTDVFIHLAADTRPESEAMPEDAEIAAARTLFDSLPANVRVIFVSSQSAVGLRPTRYGRVKRQIEAFVLERHGIVVRPGLVYSNQTRAGLHSRLTGIVARLLVLPDLWPAPVVQPIHVDDLAQGLLSLARRGESGRTYELADPVGITLTDYLRAIARLRLGRWRPTISVPAGLALIMARWGRPVLRPIGIDPDRIIGLMSIERLDSAPSLAAVPLKLRAFPDGLRHAGWGRRRELLMEGRTLLAYIGGTQAPRGAIMRYVRALEQSPRGDPLGLPMAMVAMPSLLRLAEARGIGARRQHPDLERRLDIATVLFETTPIGAERFLALKRRARFNAVAELAGTLVGELSWQLLRLIRSPKIGDRG
jgi:nucleoside-diphosphate-sugar epimerase